MLALPLFNLGILCIGAAQTQSRALIKLSVAMRLWVMAAVAAVATLAAVRLVPPIALAIGVVDLISATLTAWALVAERSSDQEAPN